MSRQTKELALCAVLCALGTVLLCLAGMLPFAEVICPLLASCVLCAAECECSGKKLPAACFAATAVLGLLLGPDKEAALLYCFLGYYPLVKFRFERIRPPVLRTAVKLAYFSVTIAVMYALILYVLGLQSVVEEFRTSSAFLLAVTFLIGMAVFILYDILLGRFRFIWIRRRHKNN